VLLPDMASWDTSYTHLATVDLPTLSSSPWTACCSY
jgi:hypothetical protein